MPNHFYKIRKNRLVAGVVAGLADKFGWQPHFGSCLSYYSHGFHTVWNLLILSFSPPPSL